MTGHNILLSGELTAEGHFLTQRVYYEDTDFSGVGYHARYLHFLERGRTDFLRCLGIEQANMTEENGDRLSFVVMRMEIDFKSSARMDDILEIVTSTQSAAGARLILDQEIRRGQQVLIAARATIALINAQGRPRRMPRKLVDCVRPH